MRKYVSSEISFTHVVMEGAPYEVSGRQECKGVVGEWISVIVPAK